MMPPLMQTPNRAMLTIIGLYNWDDQILDLLHLPTGVDAEVVKYNILMECGEMSLIYPDWDFMYLAIDYWSQKELPTWERVYELSQLEYNPIENYDRIENEIESENVAENRSKSAQSARSNNGTSTYSSTENTQSGSESDSVSQNNTVNQVAGFNTDTLATQSGSAGNTANTDKSTGSSISKADQSSSNAGEETGTENEINQGDTARNRNRASRIHGNIGVSTPADMMEKELSIYPKINIVEFITRSFKERFCVLVY